MNDSVMIRVVAGTAPGDSRPTVACALDEAIWEVMSDDDWQRIRNEMLKAAGFYLHPDYEWREVVLKVNAKQLADALDTPVLKAETRDP